MKNCFENLMALAAADFYQRTCSVGDWCFEVSGAGNIVVSHKGDAVVSCENNQIIDAKWGSRIADIEVRDILSGLLKHVPHIHLDAMSVRTEDCLDALGYDGPAYPIADVPGLEDIDYYRAWVTNKENQTDPEKADYVVYWDQGNTWCEVLAVFEGVTHEEFVAAMHSKYAEWLREEVALELSLPEENSPNNQNIDFSLVPSIDNLIKEAATRTITSDIALDLKERGSEPEF